MKLKMVSSGLEERGYMKKRSSLLLVGILIFAFATISDASVEKALDCAQRVGEGGDKLLQGCNDTSIGTPEQSDEIKNPAYEYDALTSIEPVSSVVLPEVPTVVELSSSDVNRLICPEGLEAKDLVTDVVFSKEKGVIAKVVGRNVFVKFKIQKKDNREIYSKTPTEIYVVCGDVVYNIIAVPKRIPAKTVTLSLNINKIKKNVSVYGSLPFEKKVLTFIKSVYRDEIPETFSVSIVNKKIDIYKDIDLSLVRIIAMEGEGLRLKEYIASIKGDVEEITFKEKDFLNTEVTTRPVAISLTKLNIKKGESTRIFVVEQGGLSDK